MNIYNKNTKYVKRYWCKTRRGLCIGSLDEDELAMIEVEFKKKGTIQNNNSLICEPLNKKDGLVKKEKEKEKEEEKEEMEGEKEVEGEGGKTRGRSKS